MKNKIILSGIIILLIVALIITGINLNNNKKSVAVNNIATDNVVKDISNMGNIIEESNSKEENEEINEIKYNMGVTGDSNIYEIQKDEYDDREVVVVKPSIKYKVAFTGMIKKDLPSMQEINSTYEQNRPQKNGVWIESNSRQTILNMINDSNLFNNNYGINPDGYLYVQVENNSNTNDIKLTNAINSNKLYILSISSTCYIVDDVTGEILKYSFEDMDKYQTYEYFNNENQYIIFITENKNNILSSEEILSSVISLFEGE